MSIIDRIKKEAENALQEYIQNVDQTEQEGTQNEMSRPQNKQLIKEIENLEATDQEEQSKIKYQQQQFEYFASKNKTKQLKCIVCKKNNPKYTCPKCKVPYCSIDHYKSHNLFCTERFFKDQVQCELKAMKSSKEDKKKMVEILKANRQQCAKDQNQLQKEIAIEEISEERLEKLLEMIENDEDVILTQNQAKAFQTYLKDIELASMSDNRQGQKQSQGQEQEELPFKQSTPFWCIQEGLALYYAADQFIEIQQYNQSPHKKLLNYRQLSAQLLREDLPKLLQCINFKKTSVFVNFQLIQMIYLTALLFRVFNGQYLKQSEFAETFLLIYDQNLAKHISESCPSQMIEVLKQEISVISPIKANISRVKSSAEIMQLCQAWLPYILQDCLKIFDNKYLCLQTLLRLQQAVKSISNEQGIKWSDEVMQPIKKQKNKKSKQEKEKQKKILKMIKKIEFLMCFTSEVVYRDPIERNQEGDLQPIRTLNNKAIIISSIKKDLQNQQNALKERKLLSDYKQSEKQRRINTILVP